MLAAEARVCARLDHPGIVKVYEFGEVDGEHYLAMELVDGWDLHEILAAFERAGRVPPVAFVAHLGAELADALAYAHALTDDHGHPLGFVHRDVSPGNVMINQGAVKLVDFGVHTIRDRRAEERTAVGVLRGTLTFMSPEQADGLPVDHRSDVFSLGSVLYEALTGQRLFGAPSELQTLRRVREAVVPPPSSHRGDLDPRIHRIVLAMMARSPAERTPSGDEVARALRPFAQSGRRRRVGPRIAPEPRSRRCRQDPLHGAPQDAAADARGASGPCGVAVGGTRDRGDRGAVRDPRVQRTAHRRGGGHARRCGAEVTTSRCAMPATPLPTHANA